MRRLWRLDGRNEALALVALLLATRLLPRAVPGGIYGIGLVDGARIAVQGIALVLVFRSNRIINFAQAGFALSAGLFFSALIEYRTLLRIIEPVCISDCTTNPLAVDINYWVSVVLTLAFMAGLGWLASFLVVRRFANAPRLLLTVATIFIGYTVLSVTTYVTDAMEPPRAGDDQRINLGSKAAELPFNHTWRIGEVTFHAVDFVTVGVVAVLAAALYLYLRKSATGTAIRAASENPDRAATLGIDVQALTTRVWVGSAVLAGVAGVLGAMAEGVAAGGLTGSEVGILAAAVVARFVSLPMAAAAAVVLSVLEQALQWNGKIAWLDIGLFALIIVLLLVQARRSNRAEQALAGEWKAAREIRPIPRELRGLPTVQTWTRVGMAALTVILLGYPWIVEPGRVSTVSLVFIYAVIGLSLLVLTGWAGQISLGQVGFAAVGSFVTAASGLPFLLAIVVGSLAGGVAALVIGIPALRLRGLHLAVLTLAFHQAIVTLLLIPNRYLGVHLPQSVDRPVVLGMGFDDQRVFYYFALLSVILVVLAVLGLRRSRTARALLATRDNEQAAQSFGINLTRARVGAFAMSGVISAFAGVLLAYHQGGVDASAFNLALSRQIFLYSVIGGLGSIAGPLIGFAYYALPLLMTLPGLVPLLLTGPGGIALILMTPGGIGQILFDARDNWLRKTARRHRIVVPSLLADTAEDDEPVPLAPKARPGGGTAFVPVRYHLPGQWAVDGVEVMHDRA